MSLGDSQRLAYNAAHAGNNLFITGSAGTGKSYLLKYIYNALVETKKVHITALTGCAAYLLSEDIGVKVNTIHSWAGIGYGGESVDYYVKDISKKHPLRQRWRTTDVLIIDEVSMMSAEMFDKLCAIGSGVRKSPLPFGGIQVICVGDFFQLPPVIRGRAAGPIFAFQSPMWTETIHKTILLDTIFRQSDHTFQNLLEEARHGHLSESSIAVLRDRMTDTWKKRTIKPTLIFTKRAVVDDINKRNLDALKGEKYTYNVKTTITPEPKAKIILTDADPLVKDSVEKLDAEANYITTLTLCKKAQVMLIKNIDLQHGLVNGSRGVIVDFTPKEIASETHIVSREKLPTEEAAPPEVLEPVKTPTPNGYIYSVIHKNIIGNEIVVKEMRKTFVYLPVVLFVGQTEPSVIDVVSWPSCIEPSVSRTQIPLALAWAVTTHKIQGATLDCALIDIGEDVFEYGQAYVALSRVKSLDSLYVHNLKPSCVRAHPLVKSYYENLTNLPAVEVEATPSIPPPAYFSVFNMKKGNA
jgi:ATP-dependent DNA helicase PIF1